MTESLGYPRMRWLVLVAVCFGYMSVNMYAISLAAILPHIAQNLSIDIGTASNFMSWFMFAAASALVLGGFICDRYGIMPVVILSSLCASGGALIMTWIGTSYQTALSVRVLEGVGTGLIFCTMSPIMAVWFPPKERGLVTGLFGTSNFLGAVIGFPLSAAIFEATKSWQEMSGWLSIVGWISLVLTLVVVLMPKPNLPSYTQVQGIPGSRSAFGQALREPTTWVCAAVAFFAAWMLQTIYNVIPTYMAADRPLGLGYGHVIASKLMLGASIAGVLAPIASGIIQDKLFGTNARPFMFIGFGLSCLSVYLILTSFVYASIPLLVVCLALAGSGIAVGYAAIPLFVAANYPLQTVGKVFGVCFGIGGFGGAAGLFAAGAAVAKHGNYQLGITLISLAGLAAFALVFLLRRPEKLEAGRQIPL